MHLEFTEEHDALRSLVRDFAEREIAPHADVWDREHRFPTEVVRAMGELGLFGIPFPEEYGGGGGDLTMLCIAIEELARVDHSMAITLEAGVGLGANPIHLFGTEQQKQQWLPELCAGRALGAFGLTEPEAGSDAGGTRTTAELDDGAGEWVLNGEKAFITNSGTDITALVTVTARTGPGEISAIIIPAGTPGLDVQPAYRKMGWHASDTHGLTLTDCRVPADNLLGVRGRGFAQFLQILDEGRVALASLAVGCVQACLELSVRYAQDRSAFGRPIGANQGVAFPIADLAVMAETARLLTYQAAWLRDTGRPFKRAAAMAKLHATESAVTATRIATQVFGGSGFIDETPVARFYRDAKILEIGEGTSEIQRLVISRELGLPVQ
ncbi:MAG: acyl-CoA dehydrogenase family protein [Microthrixaceae bacterium]